MQNTTTISSDTSGLWSRMLINLAAYWIGGIWFLFICAGVVHAPSLYFLLLVVTLTIIIYYTVKIVRNHPLKWKKTIAFDFENKAITIISDYEHQNQQDILDESIREIEFSDIQELQANVYDSFLSSSYYQISLLLKSGRTIRLLALKSPNIYTELISKFKKSGLLLS